MLSQYQFSNSLHLSDTSKFHHFPHLQRGLPNDASSLLHQRLPIHSVSCTVSEILSLDYFGVTTLTVWVTLPMSSRDHKTRSGWFPIGGPLTPNLYLTRFPRYYASRIWGHDLDHLGSCDVIDQVTVRSAVGGFLQDKRYFGHDQIRGVTVTWCRPCRGVSAPAHWRRRGARTDWGTAACEPGKHWDEPTPSIPADETRTRLKLHQHINDLTPTPAYIVS